jgi:hypothetical protein
MTGGMAMPDPSASGNGPACPGSQGSSAEPDTLEQLAGLAALRALAAIQQQGRQASAETMILPPVPPQARREIGPQAAPSRLSAWWRAITNTRAERGSD